MKLNKYYTKLEAMDCMYVLCYYDPMGAWFVCELKEGKQV